MSEINRVTGLPKLSEHEAEELEPIKAELREKRLKGEVENTPEENPAAETARRIQVPVTDVRSIFLPKS